MCIVAAGWSGGSMRLYRLRRRDFCMIGRGCRLLAVGSFLAAARRAPRPRSLSMDAHMPAASRRPVGRFRAALRDALVAIAIALGLAAPALAADELPIFDTHLHYSHDAWDNLP